VVNLFKSPRAAFSWLAPKSRIAKGELRKAPGFLNSQLTIHHSLRVGLILLATLLVIGAGIALAPGLAPKLRIAKGELRKAPGFLNSRLTIHHSLQPDWGGGNLSFPAGSAAGIFDSFRTAAEGDVRGHDPESNSGFGSCPQTRTYSGQAGGAALREKSGGDYALALALPSSGVFELPSTSHFRKQLLPGAGDAEAPAADIPLYPQSSCRMQVGQGTACFVGFYLSPDSVEAVRSFYVRVLNQLGWERITAGRQGPMETFAKRNEDRAVVVQLRKQDSVTTRIGLVVTTAGRPDRNERK